MFSCFIFRVNRMACCGTFLSWSPFKCTVSPYFLPGSLWKHGNHGLLPRSINNCAQPRVISRLHTLTHTPATLLFLHQKNNFYFFVLKNDKDNYYITNLLFNNLKLCYLYWTMVNLNCWKSLDMVVTKAVPSLCIRVGFK